MWHHRLLKSVDLLQGVVEEVGDVANQFMAEEVVLQQRQQPSPLGIYGYDNPCSVTSKLTIYLLYTAILNRAAANWLQTRCYVWRVKIRLQEVARGRLYRTYQVFPA